VLGLSALEQSQTFTTLHNFTGRADGAFPEAGVIQDRAGNLYGTAALGGHLGCYSGWGCGVVYEMNTAGTETVLHSFSKPDGFMPYTPLARDDAGNLYGTTVYGGSHDFGAVFKIDSAGNETLLHSFPGGRSDGCNPEQGLVRDKAGNLYGTTNGCGTSGGGTLFKVDSAGNETVLHNFAGGSSDGAMPQYGHLAMDKYGNLYGLTQYGGAGAGCSSGCGVLYKLSKSGTLTVLHSFAGGASDGCYPFGSVTIDKARNLYGTTLGCGASNGGTIWEVSKKGKKTILHSFAGRSDGCDPWAGVTRDSKGNMYGVTYGCGANYDGALYELSANGTLTLLHSFDSSDGLHPLGEVLRTADGTLFGTTAYGGAYGDGTAWKYVP